MVAGNQTTRIAIAQGILAFCQHPEQWDRLRADPAAVGTAADEVLRWTCPTHFMRRTATADTELGGAPIRAGDKVVLWYVSGNRDEAEFADPDVFDIGRAPNRHLSFGRGGPHLCLGVHLARLEVRVVLAALARRVARFELAGLLRRIRSNFTNGLRVSRSGCGSPGPRPVPGPHRPPRPGSAPDPVRAAPRRRNVRKIDAFAHILPPGYAERLESITSGAEPAAGSSATGSGSVRTRR